MSGGHKLKPEIANTLYIETQRKWNFFTCVNFFFISHWPGDGNLQKNNGIIRIYTNSFTKLEVEMLARAISNKLGIITRVVHDRNDQYMLCISRSQLDKVITQLEGHMHPSMLYKLGITNNSFDIEKILAQVR